MALALQILDMETKPIANLASFNQQLRNAILAIGLFIFVYLILLLTGSLIALFALFGGFALIAASPSLLTILLGLGIIGMGVFIFVFLIKFLFKKNVIDRSHLLEIKAQDEPELFALLEEIVAQTHTHFPKKVYLSAAVNASVFYDSSFWSMFFPVKKNLEIGLGLVNGVTKQELKAILAHEFGHFSQQSMKVGSYVYHVNQVIYNLLYENEGYSAWLNRWASLSAYFAIFTKIAVWIIQGMQWVLQKIYNLLNLSYMGLSREMEFHADEVAAKIAGPQALITGLARLSFVDSIFSDVLNHYNRRIPDNVRTQNMFPMHRFAIQFMAKENQLELRKELPLVDADKPSIYNQSHLVVKDQWASHPSTPERAEALRKLQLESAEDDFQNAGLFFQQLDQWQKQLTDRMFEGVEYKEAPRNEELEEFQAEYLKQYEKNSFAPLYRGYYDFHNPVNLGVEELVAEYIPPRLESATALFDDAAIELMYSAQGLEHDLAQLEHITAGNVLVQSFDYAGKKYHKKECADLMESLKQQLEKLKAQIKTHDQHIFDYFYLLAQKQQQEQQLVQHYQTLFTYDRAYAERVQVYQDVINHLAFTNEQTPFAEIEQGLETFKPLEVRFKDMLEFVLAEPMFKLALTEELSEQFKAYLAQEWVYFVHPTYQEEALTLLFQCTDGYIKVLHESYFNLKKELLSFQVNLETINSKNTILP